MDKLEWLDLSRATTAVDNENEIERSLDMLAGEKHDKIHFLTLAAFSHSDVIAEQYWKAYCNSGPNKWTDIFRTNNVWDTSKFRDILEELQSHSLVQVITQQPNAHTFFINNTVRTWIEHRGSQDQKLNIAFEFMMVLTSYLQATDEAEMLWQTKQETLRHIDSYIQFEAELPCHPPQIKLEIPPQTELLFAVAYTGQSRYGEAESLFKRALAGYEKLRGPGHPETLQVRDRLAIVYNEQGHYSQAEDLLQQTLALKKRSLGLTHRYTIQTMGNLGSCYRLQGHYEKAEALFQWLLLQSGLDYLTILTTKQNLATVYSLQGKHNKAEPLFLFALAEERARLKSGHLKILLTMHNLANLYYAQKEYGKAESLYKTALAGREKKLGPKHLWTISTTGELAIVYMKQRRFEEAEDLLKRAVKGSETTLGSDHLWTLGTIEDLAIMYTASGHYNKAEAIFHDVLIRHTKLQGPEHPDTLLTVHNLGFLYQKQERFGEAEELYKRALKSDNTARTLQTIQALATIYRLQQRDQEAEELLGGLQKFPTIEKTNSSEAILSSVGLRALQPMRGIASIFNGRERLMSRLGEKKESKF